VKCKIENYIYFFNKYNTMSAGANITIIGMSIIFFYALIKILNFYGIGSNVYGVYLFFYASIILSMFVLPNSESTI